MLKQTGNYFCKKLYCGRIINFTNGPKKVIGGAVLKN